MSERAARHDSSGKLDVPRRFTRSAVTDEEWELRSAAWLVEYMSHRVGLVDLRHTDVLDVGCGVKFTKLFLNHRVPISHYVGVDVNREMIEFLQTNVEDPRFQFFHLNVKNDLYNPDGDPFDDGVQLPFRKRAFDLICLFSVFTHLDPDDYRTMLNFLRPYVRPYGRLFFSLYIDELTEGGYGLIDSLSKMVKADSRLADTAPRGGAPSRPVARFRDLDPTRPLLLAVYSEEYARELIEDTRWRIVAFSRPDVYIQHSFVCAPV